MSPIGSAKRRSAYVGDGQARDEPLLDVAEGLVEPEDEARAEAGRERPAVAAIELADLLQTHLVEAVDLLFARAAGRRPAGMRELQQDRRLDDRAGWKWARAQAAPMVGAIAPATVKPRRVRRSCISVASMSGFAAEEMADAGDVEDEVAVRRRGP